jgi:hypothetical protein
LHALINVKRKQGEINSIHCHNINRKITSNNNKTD